MKNFAFFLMSFAFITATSQAEVVPFQYFYSGPTKIAFRSFGTGEPLFLLNGGPGRSSDTFTELAQALSAKGRRIILFDQRGTGRSKLASLNENTISLSLMLDDLEALRKHLGYETISILGHSFGGMYAMSYAAVHPEHISKLILSASGGIDLSWRDYANHNMISRLSAQARRRYFFWTSPEQEKKNPARAFAESTRLLVPAYIYHPKFIPQLERDLTNPNYSSLEINMLVWKSMENYNLKGAFKRFTAPTLILAGRQDILGEQVPLSIQAEIPNSRLEFIDECSHYPWLDQPTQYFNLIGEFLNHPF